MNIIVGKKYRLTNLNRNWMGLNKFINKVVTVVPSSTVGGIHYTYDEYKDLGIKENVICRRSITSFTSYFTEDMSTAMQAPGIPIPMGGDTWDFKHPSAKDFVPVVLTRRDSADYWHTKDGRIISDDYFKDGSMKFISRAEIKNPCAEITKDITKPDPVIKHMSNILKENCALGIKCNQHIKKEKYVFIPRIDEWDLLPDA